jgi:hypothetical protein
MRFVYCLLLIALFSCRANDDHTVGPEQLEDAYIHDTSQFADGCELYIQLDTGSLPPTGVQYKPSPATLPIAQRAIKDFASTPKDQINLPVKIRFLETTNKVVIHCGWVSPTVTEIKILEISKR